MTKKYDAVVIGAGHNGLISAIQLAEKGWKVLVLEKSSKPGGASKSGEVTEPDYVHDLYAMNINLFLGSQFYQKYGEEMQRFGFEPVVNDKPYASVFPDETGIGAYQNRKEMFKSLAYHSTDDTYAWKHLSDYYDQTTPHFMPLMQMELPSYEAWKHVLKSMKQLKLNGLMELGSHLLQSPREFVDHWFEDDKVKAMVAPWGLHLDFGPDVSNGAVFPFLESILNQRNGMTFSKGGIQKMIDSMVKMLEIRLGEIRTEASVERVLVESGQAYGVVLEDGEEIVADKAVIGNVTPTQMVNRLLNVNEIPDHYLKQAENYRYGPATMMIHLSLDEPLQWKAGEKYSEFAYVHIGPYVEDLARTYTQAMNGELPDSPLLIVGQPDVMDETRSPEGKSTLWIQVRALPSHVKKDSLNEIEADDWSNIKEAYADRVIEKLSAYTHNSKRAIRKRTVLSPADLEGENPNLVGGDSVSGSHHIFQNYVFRPSPGYSRYQTPIDRLYMVGAATWPGGGLNGTSGWLLAEKL
ncbi:phytoene desaturase family protein [Halobacillus sp. K22]|uniref:phytoene desaturase family protein n=1 Tax=Halobacillus sp. K22 TaxID=3457431 RepID=UPI003FCEB76B